LSTTFPRRIAATLLAAAALASLPTAAPAASGSGGGAQCAAFTVIVNGQAFRGDQQRTISGPITSIQVRGTFIDFDVDPSTFSVRNYTRTAAGGAATVVFTERKLDQGAALTTPLQLELNDERLRLERRFVPSGQATRIEAEDCAQGDDLLRMRPARVATMTNTLGPGFTYRARPSGQQRLCFTNGQLSGADEPENAVLTARTATVATWRVQANGRLRTELGQAAVEDGCRP
jgi:hypothetical protein